MNVTPPIPSRSLQWFATAVKWSLWLLLAAWLVLALAWGALHGWIVPRIGDFRPDLEMRASRALGVPVRIGQITAQSIGLVPSFELHDVVLLDAQGRERQRLVGSAGDLERELQAVCQGQPMPSDEDLQPVLERNPEPRSTLRFPTGLAVSADRLYIADSGHHRILECTHSGRLLRQFGIGTADFVDGVRVEAAFKHPQGLALARESLYVADTGNHALRRINLMSEQVDTLCGNCLLYTSDAADE